MADPMNPFFLLHVYGQKKPRDPVRITGSQEALMVLRSLITSALSLMGGRAKTTVHCADGEKYDITVEVQPAPWQVEDWQAHMPLPYWGAGQTDFSQYQAAAQATSGQTDGDAATRQIVAALGLAGEAGEFANLTKKRHFHGHPVGREKFIDEAGDVLWYLAEAATAHGLTLDEIARFNLDKLKRRYPQGFSEEASWNRPVE